jgi:predicted site-specific integrase-resolvase
MNTYTVANISTILGVTEETVRRWLRSDKLHGTINSKKQGYIVEDSDLKEFVQNKSKYLKAYRNHKFKKIITTALTALKNPEVQYALRLHMEQQRMIAQMKLAAKLQENEV